MTVSSNRHRYLQDAPTVAPDEPASTPVGEHTHEQPRGAQRALMVAVVFLLITTAGFGYLSYQTDQRLSALEDYVAGRGEQRDRENEQLNERIDDAVCDVLDQLPAGGLFDPIRAQYGCGPGIPVDELDPQAAQNLADILGEIEDAQPTATAEPAPLTSAPDEMPPGAPPGAQPSPMGQAPTTTAAPTTAPVTPVPTAAPTTAAPLVDLTPLTDPVCTLLGVCVSP